MGSCYVTQADLELLWSSGPSAQPIGAQGRQGCATMPDMRHFHV